MSRVFVIGGATLDTIIEYEDMERMVFQRKQQDVAYLLLEEGRKIEVTKQQQSTGGGATNTAVSFLRQGFEVGLFCKVGQDTAGDILLSDLERHGIDTRYVVRSDSAGTSASFVVPALSGDRTLFAYRGANTCLLTEDLPLVALSEYDFVYVTSLSGESAARLPEIASYAKTLNTTVAINPGISQLKLGSGFLASALQHLDILIMNYEEAQQFMASLMLSDESLKNDVLAEHTAAYDNAAFLDARVTMHDMCFSLKQVFSEVLKLGPKMIVVTNGSKGVYVATPSKIYYHPAAEIPKIANTLGAGDAFGSSFVGMLQQGRSIEDAIRAGVVNSGAVVQEHDAKTGLQSADTLNQAVSAMDASLCQTWDW